LEIFSKRLPIKKLTNANRHKDGHIIYLETNALPIIDKDDILIGYRGADSDITEKIQHQNEILTEKNLSDFYLDLLSHDIGNIHQGINLAFQMVKLKNNDGATLIDSMNVSQRLIERSIELVKNVKFLSSLKSLDLILEPIDLVEVILDQIKSVKNLFSNKNIPISFNPSVKELMIDGEPLLGQLFFNILHNSCKLHENEQMNDFINITMIKKGKNVKIEISDHGPGIKDNQKRYLFDRMSHSNEKIHRGLGLLLVNELVTRYQGTIEAQDRIEGDYSKGINMIITLPLHTHTKQIK
jgi:signal transduction histidine kinase